jgi:broad specificity phosphatase PhoE
VAPTTILIARHGETDWNRDGRFQGHADPPLNSTGRAQAAELASELADAGITAVHSSDLRRAAETAAIVAARLGIEVIPQSGLREIDVGEFQGLTHGEIDARWPEARARFEELGFGWRQGETFEELSGRVVATLLAIGAAHPGERVLAVGHGGTVRAALAYADGLDVVAHRRAWPGPAGNCSVHAVVVVDGVLRRPDT